MDRHIRIVTFSAVAMLAGCGASEPGPREPSAPDTRAASSGFAQQCSEQAGFASVAVLCPARLPLGGFESPRGYGDAPCTYLIDLEPRGVARRPGTVDHMLFGGTCRPWDMRPRHGRWPATSAPARAGVDLRLIGSTSLIPGQTEADRKRVGLRVLRRARIGSDPALVLRNPPYPVGGIHGGHISVVWNAGGAGYAVTGHPVASPERPDSNPGPGAIARAIDTLLGIAGSMRRPRD